MPTDVLLRVYRTMVLLRAIDERMLKLQRQGKVAMYGQSRGQEAAAVASAAALRDEDWIFPALRETGAALYRGFPLEKLVAQCFGSAGDEAKGRQMPCHYGWRAGNFVTLSSCIGTQIPHAVGVAFAARIRKEETIAVAYMGDGATSEGDFHVALNFAGVQRLPVVFFCQNNQWAISVPVTSQTASKSIAIKAVAYGLQGVRVDGNDALAVFEVTREAAKRARTGGGPTLIEAVTYRMGAHTSSDDPTRYRKDEEILRWERKDPIDRVRRHLEDQGLWDEARQESLEDRLREQIAAAIRKVEAEPPPPKMSLVEDVYAVVPWHLREQLEGLL